MILVPIVRNLTLKPELRPLWKRDGALYRIVLSRFYIDNYPKLHSKGTKQPLSPEWVMSSVLYFMLF